MYSPQVHEMKWLLTFKLFLPNERKSSVLLLKLRIELNSADKHFGQTFQHLSSLLKQHSCNHNPAKCVVGKGVEALISDDSHATHRADYVHLVHAFHSRRYVLLFTLQVSLIFFNNQQF